MDDLRISASELNARLARGVHLLLVDVREPSEYDLCRIDGAKLIPLATTPGLAQSRSSLENMTWK